MDNFLLAVGDINHKYIVVERGDAKMVSFENFKAVDGSPIYQQILEFVKKEAAAGNIENGEELPSRRVLSALLGINPNTVQKAFKLLEDEGLIESRAGAKSYMVMDEKKIKEMKAELLETKVRSITETLRQMGISKGEAVSLIEKYWEEE